jgi:phage tail sheath protein FI
MLDMDEPTEFVAEERTHRQIVGRVPARIDATDPEWKYVNLRRFLIYLEHSIDEGTQWAVFEPNGEELWAEVRRTVTDFLYGEWRDGALKGDRPEAAFFVRCDRTTMTQNDLDNGRLICEIGVAPLKPAEFVVFRIGQWTASTDPDSDDGAGDC